MDILQNGTLQGTNENEKLITELRKKAVKF